MAFVMLIIKDTARECALKNNSLERQYKYY